MMADKSDVIRVLGYDGDQGAQLVVSTGTFDPVGQSYFTDFVYAATASYYVGETLMQTETLLLKLHGDLQNL